MDVVVPTVGETGSPDQPDLGKEVELIHRTAEKQLASVNGLTASLAKKILKSEAQTNFLLAENKALENKNADLIAQLHRAQDDVRNLSIKEAQLVEAEKNYNEAASAVVNAELMVKKLEAQLDSVRSERDAFESKSDTLRLQNDDLHNQLEVALDQAEKDKASREADIQDRSLKLEAAIKEKENEQRNRDSLQQQIEERNRAVDDLNLELTNAINDKEKSDEEGQLKLQDAESRLAQLRAELDIAATELNDLKQEHHLSLEQTAKLEDSVVVLTEENVNVKDQLSRAEDELVAVKEALLLAEKEKDVTKTDLDAKIVEATELASNIARLREEHDEIKRHHDELMEHAEVSRKDADTAKTELKSRNFAFNSLESERNLLVGEKVSLEKDYTDARDRCTLLEREKGLLEKRVYDLEDIEKRLATQIEILKKEKIKLKDEFERELHEKIAEKEANFEMVTAALRKELDDVVDRHAAMHRMEMGREEAAAAAIRLEGEDTVTTRTLETTVITQSTTVETNVMDDDEKEDETGATNVTEVIGPDVPMDVPEAPIPYVGSKDEPESVEDNEPGVAMLPPRIREESESEDEERVGPAEGDTSGIVNEEVMQEEVVGENAGEGDDLWEEVDEEEPVPDDVAAQRKKLVLGEKPDFNTENDIEDGTAGVDMIESIPEASKSDTVPVSVEDMTTPATEERKGLPIEEETGEKTETAPESPAIVAAGMRNAGESSTSKPRRAGSRMFNKMMCCVQTEI